MGRVTKNHENATYAEETVGSLQQQLQDLQADMENEIAQIDDKSNPTKINIEKTTLRPRKSDIAVETIALIWDMEATR